MRARHLGILLVGAVVLAGCGRVGPQGDAGLHATGCAQFESGGACDEQARLVASRHPGATQVDLTCTVPVCDRKGGAGTAVVTLANGTKVADAFVYAGAAVPLPVPTCTGLAPDVCRGIVDAVANDIPPSQPVVSIAVSCSAATCTEAKGDTEVRVRLADGSEQTMGFGWEGGLP